MRPVPCFRPIRVILKKLNVSVIMPNDTCTEPFPDCKLVGKARKLEEIEVIVRNHQKKYDSEIARTNAFSAIERVLNAK